MKKKRTCKIVDFAVPVDHRIKLKESEKKDKYLDLARELKKLWNMKVTIIPIVNDAFGTVTKGLLKGPAIPADPRVKINVSEKRERERERYLDLAGGLRKLLNMKVK